MLFSFSRWKETREKRKRKKRERERERERERNIKRLKKRVAGKLGSTKQARSRTRRRFVASLPETIPVFSSTLRFPFLFSFLSFFLFFSTLHHYAYSDREAGTMGPAFIESYIIDNRKNDSQIRYIGDDSSISFSPRSNVTTILSLSLQSRRENCVEWLGCVSSFFLLPTVFPSAARRFTVPFTS